MPAWAAACLLAIMAGMAASAAVITVLRLIIKTSAGMFTESILQWTISCRSTSRYGRSIFLFAHDLRANAIRVCPEGKPASAFPNHAPGGPMGPKKEARPKGPGTPYALQRNICGKRQKTMVCLALG
jgi:hypothetical protein